MVFARGVLYDAICESQEQGNGEAPMTIREAFELDASSGQEPFILLISMNNYYGQVLNVTLVGSDEKGSVDARQYSVVQRGDGLELIVTSGMDNLMETWGLVEGAHAGSMCRPDDGQARPEDYDQLIELLTMRGRESKARHRI